MFVLHFNVFAGYLDIQTSGSDNVPSESPLLITYKLDGELSDHEILKSFNSILRQNKIEWIKPVKQITQEWIIDLAKLKSSFDFLHRTKYLKGKITIEPRCTQEKNTDLWTDDVKISTRVEFRISEDLGASQFDIDGNLKLNELTTPLSKFNLDFANPQNCGFLMMKFEDTPIQIQIINHISEILKSNNLMLLRADFKQYSDDLLTNIKTYMHGCGFGIALFERINSNYFNPNVSLEIGYMMALNKPILFLKEKTLTSLHTDLVGKLYSEFDFQNPEETLNFVIQKWLTDHEII